MHEVETQGDANCNLTAEMNRFERQIDMLLRQAESWPQATLQLRPSIHAWCALEVLDHLRRSGESVAQQAEHELTAATTRRAGRSVRKALLFTIMRSSLRVGVPKASPELHPHVPASLDDVANNLLQVGSRLRCLFDNLPFARGNAAVFYHPVGGWMSPAAALDFLTLHAGHHMHQLERLRNQSNPNPPRPGQHSVLLPA